MNEPHKFITNLSQRLKEAQINILLFWNLSIYYTRKKIRKQCKNNKPKIIVPAWNDKFKLADVFCSASDDQDYIKKHKTLTTIPPIHVYINKINNRLVFKIKDGYKLELQTLKTVKLFWSTKNLIDKTKTGENVPSLGVVEVVLVQCILVDSQYQKKSEVSYTVTTNKSYAYLLNVKPTNLVFLKTYNTEFDEIIIILRDQNGRLDR